MTGPVDVSVSPRSGEIAPGLKAETDDQSPVQSELLTEMEEPDVAEERKTKEERLRSFKKPERRERKIKLRLTPSQPANGKPVKTNKTLESPPSRKITATEEKKNKKQLVLPEKIIDSRKSILATSVSASNLPL
jgi:hypothetical protein